MRLSMSVPPLSGSASVRNPCIGSGRKRASGGALFEKIVARSLSFEGAALGRPLRIAAGGLAQSL
jgi:hypothetical protein